jgi:hypothetical protein
MLQVNNFYSKRYYWYCVEKSVKFLYEMVTKGTY